MWLTDECLTTPKREKDTHTREQAFLSYVTFFKTARGEQPQTAPPPPRRLVSSYRHGKYARPSTGDEKKFVIMTTSFRNLHWIDYITCSRMFLRGEIRTVLFTLDSETLRSSRDGTCYGSRTSRMTRASLSLHLRKHVEVSGNIVHTGAARKIWTESSTDQDRPIRLRETTDVRFETFLVAIWWGRCSSLRFVSPDRS